MIKQLATNYIWLLDYCNQSDFDVGIFRLKHDEYAKHFQQLSLEDSGEVVCEIMRLTNRATNA